MEEYFFETTHTIADGCGFDAYGTTHLIWLFAFVAICVLSSLVYRRLGEVGRRRFLVVLSALILWNEISKYIVLGMSGHWRAEYLPLHLCSINIFVIAAYVIHKNDVVAEALYAICLPGALAALLFPSWTALPPTSFMHIHSFTVHIELFLFPLLLLVGGHKPSFRRLKRAILPLLIVAVFVYIFNKLFDTSFMFLNGAGEGNPLSFFESILGNPLYLISLPLLIGAVWLVMYGVPALIGKIWRRRTAE